MAEVKETIKGIIGIILTIIVLAFLSMWFINFGTFVHEYTGHGLTAKLLGCEAMPETGMFAGVTTYQCNTDWLGVNIIIGLSAVIVVFLVALAIWLWAGKNNILRVLAIVMMFYSCIPSAFPLLPGSDMWFVIKHGFPSFLGWSLWIIFTGVFAYLLINEVTDKQYFKKWLV